MKYFTGSFIFTIVGFIGAYFWVHFMHPGTELAALFIVFVLSILEVSLSFDNAVVNAAKLEKMSHLWRQRFLTWGIWIAVFGMRLVFPIAVVAIFSHLGFLDVVNLALNNPDKYSHYLHISHPVIITFGATFLMMLFLTFFMRQDNSVHWISFIEKKFALLGKIKGLSVCIVLLLLWFFNRYISPQYQQEALIAGIWGVIIYILIEGISSFLESHGNSYCEDKAPSPHFHLTNSCFVNFLYLELIDASFSLDGVLGAFALSKDILIITIGLSVGAMFVRSLTIMMVEKKTLKEYIYLEHGAHYAIGALALIMFISAFHEVSEVIAGGAGLLFIVSAFVSSIIYNKKTQIEGGNND